MKNRGGKLFPFLATARVYMIIKYNTSTPTIYMRDCFTALRFVRNYGGIGWVLDIIFS